MSEDAYQRIEEYKRLLYDCQSKLNQSMKDLTQALEQNAIDKIVIVELVKRVMELQK